MAVLWLTDANGGVIPVRMTSEPRENEVRVVLAQNTTPTLDIRHYLSNRTSDVPHRSLPKKGQ